MKKIATATIATAGVAAIAIAGQGHEAHAAEQGYNPNDPTSYSYSYTIDQQGNYHYTWKGNWSPDRLNHSNYNYNYNYNTYNNYSNTNSTYSYNNYHTNNSNQVASNPTQSYTTNNQHTGGLGSGYTSGRNLYTSGQCTYYVFDRVGGKIGSTWGNANNWANAAASAGYTVNNRPSAGAIMQSTAGAYGHVAYVESVNSNGSITVSEMNYGHGVGVVTSRTLSSSEAASYNFIH